MKKLSALALALAVVLALIVSASASDIGVTIDGQPVAWTDAVPFVNSDDRTMVPLRAVAEALGLDVTWDETANTATFSRETAPSALRPNGCMEQLVFTIGQKDAQYALYESTTGERWDNLRSQWTVEMDTAAVVVNDRTYAPIRYLAATFGYAVGWNNESRTAELTLPQYDFYWYEEGINENYIVYALKPAPLYDRVESVEILSASVQGQPAEIKLFDADELAGFNEDMGGGFFQAFYINADFTQYEGQDVSVIWKYRIHFKDGTSEEDEAVNSFYHQGYAGW